MKCRSSGLSDRNDQGLDKALKTAEQLRILAHANMNFTSFPTGIDANLSSPLRLQSFRDRRFLQYNLRILELAPMG
jgi:hypothetical protein